MTFNDIIGQEAVKRRLIDDVLQQRVPHALMLCGKEGTGTLPLAVALAQYLLCSGKEPQTQQPDMFGGGGLFGEPEPTPATEVPQSMLDHACGHCSSPASSGRAAAPEVSMLFPKTKKR